MIKSVLRHIARPTDIAPLAAFRFIFGALMFAATIRFAANGWINELYVEPEFLFSYFGFEWLPRPSEFLTYVLFALTAISALFICLGYRYRLAAITFFLSFTYIELLDKANYLNHYYFISIAAFALIFLPAANAYSLDAKRKRTASQKVPQGAIWAPMILLGVVYFFAGLAKVNPAWLLEAKPLSIWLPQHADFPLIGEVFTWKSTAYFMAWGGMIYDLTIVFFLWMARTRKWAFATVVFFHLLTWALFPIGMFPFIMIGLTTVFFTAKWHQKWLGRIFKQDNWVVDAPASDASFPIRKMALSMTVLGLLLVSQMLIPLRSQLYSSDLYWAEEAYRFSWRVMLMEKAGQAYFYVKDPQRPGEVEVNLGEYLTANQIKQMSTQPDMVLEFAHHLEGKYTALGIDNPEVRAEVWVSLNGEGSKLLIDPTVDLTELEDSFAQKSWILPRNNQNWLTDAH